MCAIYAQSWIKLTVYDCPSMPGITATISHRSSLTWFFYFLRCLNITLFPRKFSFIMVSTGWHLGCSWLLLLLLLDTMSTTVDSEIKYITIKHNDKTYGVLTVLVLLENEWIVLHPHNHKPHNVPSVCRSVHYSTPTILESYEYHVSLKACKVKRLMPSTVPWRHLCIDRNMQLGCNYSKVDYDVRRFVFILADLILPLSLLHDDDHHHHHQHQQRQPAHYTAYNGAHVRLVRCGGSCIKSLGGGRTSLVLCLRGEKPGMNHCFILAEQEG